MGQLDCAKTGSLLQRRLQKLLNRELVEPSTSRTTDSRVAVPLAFRSERVVVLDSAEPDYVFKNRRRRIPFEAVQDPKANPWPGGMASENYVH